MNAPANINPLNILALQIVTGDMSGLPKSDSPYYSDEEWLFEAQSALDSGDYDSLAGAVHFERAHAEWLSKPESFQQYWSEDCAAWFAAIGSREVPSELAGVMA